mgnify:CR=1 FL=1
MFNDRLEKLKMRIKIGIALLVLFTSCKGTSQEKEMSTDIKVENTKEFSVQKTLPAPLLFSKARPNLILVQVGQVFIKKLKEM